MTLHSKDSTVDELVAQFAQACVEQDRALANSKMVAFRARYEQMESVDQELRKRGRDARQKLFRLYNHPNAQVRLQAARFTLGIAPIQAREVIEAISKSGRMPQAGDARGTLRNLDEGAFKPD